MHNILAYILAHVFFGLNVWKKKLIGLDTKFQKQKNAECRICATRLVVEIFLCFFYKNVRSHYIRKKSNLK